MFENLSSLNSQMSALSNSLDNLCFAIWPIVPSYSGNSKHFQKWIKAIEKEAFLENLDDECTKKLAFRSSRDTVSDFIHRFLQENPNESWTTLKQKLVIRFADVTDPMHPMNYLRPYKNKNDIICKKCSKSSHIKRLCPLNKQWLYQEK